MSCNCTVKTRLNTLFALTMLSSIILAITSNQALAKEPKGKQQSTAVCDYVMQAANQNQMQDILIPTESEESTKVTQPSGPDNTDFFSWGGIVFKQLIDLNNDGRPERVFVNVQGSLQIQSFQMYPEKSDTPIDIKVFPDDENQDWDYAFVKHQGVNYLIGLSGLKLAYIAKINPANEMRTICRFGQEAKSFRRITNSLDNKLCERYLTKEPEAFEYDQPHDVDEETVRAGMESSFGIEEPREMAALLDINNDGRKRLVVSLTADTSNACGSLEYPMVLTDDGKSIDIAFSKQLPEGTCRMTIFPFIDQSKTYFGHAEYRYGAESELKLTRIELLERGVLKPICKYEVRPINYLLTPEQVIKRDAKSKSNSVWHEAISRPGTEAVQTLISAGYSLNGINQAPQTTLPLTEAIRAERPDILELLLKAGANSNQRDTYAETPLHEALRFKSPKAIELLLRYGADPADESRGTHTPIAAAVSTGDLVSLRTLLEAGSTITDTAAMDVIQSTQKDRHDKLRLLLAYGLDPNRLYADYAPVKGAAQADPVLRSYGIRLVEPTTIKGITQVSPGVYTVGPEITIKRVSMTLREWAAEFGDAETVRILTEAAKQKPKGGLIQRLRAADDDLNRAYKLLTAATKKEQLPNLKKQQRDWVKERDKRCGSAFASPSRVDWLRHAAANEKRGQCVLEATRNRTDTLTEKLYPALYLPNQLVAGHSQANWSKEYWRWSKSFPPGQGPTDDQSGVRCSSGQPDKVWFLTGSIASKPVQRQCTIPAGRPIFFPVLASHAEAPAKSATCNTLLGVLNSHTLSAKNLKVLLDGKEIAAILPRWRQATDCYKQGESIISSDGYWLALKPLPPGKHTLRFGGEMEQDGFRQDVTYDLLVQ
jgi:uncharacterized protein YecT (DUF1311 family)